MSHKIGDWDQAQLDRRVRQLITNQNLPKRITGTTFKGDTIEVIKDLKLPKDVVDGRSLSWNSGTSPPPYPKAGDVWSYTPSTGGEWSFKYRPDVDSTYPWHFIGGTPVLVGPAGSITKSTTTPEDLTSGPTFTLPRIGIYVVQYGCESVQNNGVWSAPYNMDVHLVKAGTSIRNHHMVASAQYAGGASKGVAKATTAAVNEQLKIQVGLQSAVGSVFADGWLYIVPTKVS